jgi:hypothetical protein
MKSPVTSATLGGLHGTRTTGTASFKVLVSPPSLGLAARAVGCYSHLSSTPSGTRAEVEALVDRSSAIAFSVRGMCCRSRTSKSFSSLRMWSRYAAKCGSLQQQSPLTCLMMSWESPFMRCCRTPSDKVILNPKSRASYSAMLLVALKSRCTIYLNWSPCGVRSSTPAPHPCLRDERQRRESSGVW